MNFELPKSENGIPLMGIGSGTAYYKRSSNLPFNEKLVNIFTTAIENGFVHLDSAEIYDNDQELKETLKRTLTNKKIKREDIFITDKYYIGDESYKSLSSFKNPYTRIKYLLKTLETPYIDLFLIHSPFIKRETHGFDLKEAWKYMQKCYDEGLVKKIGVSNFTVDNIQEIWDTTKTNPMVNQIEFSAFLQNQTPGIVEFCQSRGITIEAFSPLSPITVADTSKGAGLNFISYLDQLAKKYSKTRTQVLLRWIIQMGIIPITTTSKIERFEEYKGIFNWSLNSSEIQQIASLGSAYKPAFRKYWKPEFDKYN